MGRIFSDVASETYRKYIVKIKLSNRRFYYFLWGTDLDNEDVDYLLLNLSNKIMAFLSITDLLTFVKHTSCIIDDTNTKSWANSYKGSRAYITYDFASLINFLDEVNTIGDYEKKSAMMVINFCNFFSDYAFQVNRQDLLNLYREDNLGVLIASLNIMFFWEVPNSSYKSELEGRLSKFDILKANETITKMVNSFERELVIMDNV